MVQWLRLHAAKAGGTGLVLGGGTRSQTLTSIHDHWKTIALTRRTFVGKVISLLFNMLSRLVIAFLPRSVFQFHGCSYHH